MFKDAQQRPTYILLTLIIGIYLMPRTFLFDTILFSERNDQFTSPTDTLNFAKTVRQISTLRKIEQKLEFELIVGPNT